ncbi:putative transmembrane protein [Toxoplasma gondii RUB]|uniref:Putative transmembrane protein n=1 Tax=Toxoplasma gondii RUB TaxID=935652 RepID=A0A086M8E3_TOXGO|nr:putative transmembrane protein [Toxoplasma gondii RUB]
MALMPRGRLLLPWRLALFRRRPRLFFFVCGAGCAYSAVNGSNPLSILPLCCCYTYDFVALACPPLQLRRALFYTSLSRGVRTVGLDSPLLDKYLLFRLCSHIQQVLLHEKTQRGSAASALFSVKDSASVPPGRRSRLAGELWRRQHLRRTYTPIPAVVDCLHHLVLSLERFNPGAQSLNLQEVYATLLPTLVLLSRDQLLQDDLRVPLFPQLPASVQRAYRPPSFFSLESSAAAPASNLSPWWPGSGIRFPSRRDESRAFSTAFPNPSCGASSLALKYLQLQHDRLLLQLLHLGLLATRRALQFAEAAAYERTRPPVELPTLLSPRVLLDTGATQSAHCSSQGGYSELWSQLPSELSGTVSPSLGRARGNFFTSPYGPRGASPEDRSQWEQSAVSGALETGAVVGEAALQWWRQFMASCSSDLAAACASRARRAATGGTFGMVSPSLTARVATAAAAEPKTVVGVCTALATLVTVPFLPEDCALQLTRIQDSEPVGGSEVFQAVAFEPSIGEESSFSRSLVGVFFPGIAGGESPGVRAVLQPLRDQLVLLQRRQQRELVVLPTPMAVSGAVAEFWEAFQKHRSTGLRIRNLVWVGKASAKAHMNSPFLEQVEGAEVLLVAAVRRGVSDINWPSSATCLTTQQRRLLLPTQTEKLEKLRFLLGSRANAAVRTPHSMHAYDKAYDDFTTRFWLWQQFNRLKEELGGAVLGWCGVAAAAALGGFLFVYLVRQIWTGETGGHPLQADPSAPSAPPTAGASSWWTRPWSGICSLFRGRGGDQSLGEEPSSGSAESRMSGSLGDNVPPYAPAGDLTHSRLLQCGHGPSFWDCVQGRGVISSPADELVRASYPEGVLGLQRTCEDSNVSQSFAPLFSTAANEGSGGAAGPSATSHTHAVSPHLSSFVKDMETGSYVSGPLSGFPGAGAAPDVLTPGLYSGRDELTSLYLALAAAGRGGNPGVRGLGRGLEFSTDGGFAGSHGG